MRKNVKNNNTRIYLAIKRATNLPHSRKNGQRHGGISVAERDGLQGRHRRDGRGGRGCSRSAAGRQGLGVVPCELCCGHAERVLDEEHHLCFHEGLHRPEHVPAVVLRHRETVAVKPQ